MAIWLRFEEIKAWQKARLFCAEIFTISQETQLAKDFKLRDQLNGSSGSIMDNVAEGFGRGGNAEFIQFLEISYASACESQSQLYRVLDRKYINDENFSQLYRLTEEIKKIILALIRYISKSLLSGPKYKLRNKNAVSSPKL